MPKIIETLLVNLCDAKDTAVQKKRILHAQGLDTSKEDAQIERLQHGINTLRGYLDIEDRYGKLELKSNAQASKIEQLQEQIRRMELCKTSVRGKKSDISAQVSPTIQ